MNQRILTAVACAAALLCYACSDDDDPTPEIDEQTEGGDEQQTGAGNPLPTVSAADYKCPDYQDNYANIAPWQNHLKWNLANVHDPSVAFFKGKYYMYGTDASYGNAHEGHGHFQGKSSANLVDWTWVPGIFHDAPAWVNTKLNEYRRAMNLPEIAAADMQLGYWAPCVRAVNVGGVDKLRMYYCVVVDNYIKTGKRNIGANYDGSWTERAFIGVAETTDPDNGAWEDQGFVTCSSSDLGRDGWARKSQSNWDGYFYFNAIDPTYIVTPEGAHWLIYGSWHSGFAALELDAATGKPKGDLGDPWADNVADLTARYGVRVATRTDGSRWQGSEAPEVIFFNGYYYLFMAYDGLDVPYNTRVVRSKSITGPYVDIVGRNCTNGRGDCLPVVTHPYKFSEGPGWVGISHCCVFQAGEPGATPAADDSWFYMSQGRFPANVAGINASNALMMGHVRRLVWAPASASDRDNLWPIALPERYGAVPADYFGEAIAQDNLVGKWEHINLKYDRGKQDASVEMELKADGNIAGGPGGTWSYDAERRLLIIGTSALCVRAEVDWEAAPRKVTLVYAGIGPNNVTWWGKKK